MEPARRCYRLVGDVLVQRTVGETLPAVKRNKDGLDGVIGKLKEQLARQSKAVEDFQAKYKIRLQGPGGSGGGGGGAGGSGAGRSGGEASGSGGGAKGPAGGQGVLVS